MKKAVLFLMLLLGSASFGTQAQEVAIKTNLLYDAFLNANLGAEVQVAPRWSLDISGDLNVWNLSHDRRWKHWLLQPEARYWFCEPLGGHFVGAHLLGGQYNIGHIDLPFKFLGTNFRSLKDFRHQGWFAGIGIAYGYTWMLHKHWNLEAEIGLGYVFTRYDSFECAGCGRKIESGRNHNYFGPTKAAINLVYVF